MKKANQAVIAALCATLLLTGCMGSQKAADTVPANPTNSTNPSEQTDLPDPADQTNPSNPGDTDPPQSHENSAKNSILLAEYEEDLFGDSTKEKIALYVQEIDGMPSSWTLKINDVEAVKLDGMDGLYGQASISLEDIDGDQKPEVLFYRYNTGSAGAQGLTIYHASDKKLNPSFSIADPSDNMEERYKMEYLGDFKVSFSDHKTGLTETIPLHKENYQDVDKELLKGISTWVDPISYYEIIDSDNDGVKEIVTQQRVIGVAHVDTIGILKTTYAMSNGQYKAVEQGLYDSNNILIKKVTLP